MKVCRGVENGDQASEFIGDFFEIFDDSGSKDDYEELSLENLELEVTRPATNDLLIQDWTAGDGERRTRCRSTFQAETT